MTGGCHGACQPDAIGITRDRKQHRLCEQGGLVRTGSVIVGPPAPLTDRAATLIEEIGTGNWPENRARKLGQDGLT